MLLRNSPSGEFVSQMASFYFSFCFASIFVDVVSLLEIDLTLCLKLSDLESAFPRQVKTLLVDLLEASWEFSNERTSFYRWMKLSQIP